MFSLLGHSSLLLLLLLAAAPFTPLRIKVKGPALDENAEYDNGIMPLSYKCFKTLTDIIVDSYGVVFFGGDTSTFLRAPNGGGPSRKNVRVAFAMYGRPLTWFANLRNESIVRGGPVSSSPAKWGGSVMGQGAMASYAYVMLHNDPLPHYRELFHVLAHEIGHAIGFHHVANNSNPAYVMYAYTSSYPHTPLTLLRQSGEYAATVAVAQKNSVVLAFNRPTPIYDPIVSNLRMNAFLGCEREYNARNKSLRVMDRYRLYDYITNGRRNRTLVETKIVANISDITPSIIEVRLDLSQKEPFIPTDVKTDSQGDAILIFERMNSLMKPYFRIPERALSGAFFSNGKEKPACCCVFGSTSLYLYDENITHGHSLISVFNNQIKVRHILLNPYDFLRKVCEKQRQ